MNGARGGTVRGAVSTRTRWAAGAVALLAVSGVTGCAPADDGTAGGSPVLLFEWFTDADSPKTLLVVDDLDGSGLREVVDPSGEGNAVHANWSPDGERFVFERLVDEGAASVWVADADGSGLAEVVTCPGEPCLQMSWPSFSPDGTSLLVTRYDRDPSGVWGSSHLVVVDLASGDQSVIASTADGSTAFYSASFSPDGSHVAVQLEDYPDAEEAEITGSVIAVVDTDPTTDDAPTPITDAALFAGYPRWHPSEDRILFASWDLDAFQGAEDSQLYTVSSTGSELRQITQEDVLRPGEASWTDAGSGIVCGLGVVGASGRVEDVVVALIDEATGEIERLPFSGAMPVQRPRP